MSHNSNKTQYIPITGSISHPIKQKKPITQGLILKILQIYYIWAKNIKINVLQASY
jgi:hypothetical protein